MNQHFQASDKGHKIKGKFYSFSLIPFTRDVAITSDGVVSRPNSVMFHKLFFLLNTTFISFKDKQLHM